MALSIVSHYITLHHIILCHIIWYHILLYIPNCITSYPILSYPIVSYPILSYHITSNHNISNPPSSLSNTGNRGLGKPGNLKHSAIFAICRPFWYSCPIYMSFTLGFHSQYKSWLFISYIDRQWRSQPDNLVPLCKFQVLYHYSFL